MWVLQPVQTCNLSRSDQHLQQRFISAPVWLLCPPVPPGHSHERCESVELDNTICDLIERSASPDPKGFPPGAMPSYRSLCSVKKEKESLNKELHELKKENKLLKEKNALANQKKQHYECEIKRLNKALQDALKMECSSPSEDCLGKSEAECSREEMRTEMEVLKQQIKACQMEKEKLERQLKQHHSPQMYFPTCNCGLKLPVWDPRGPAVPGAMRDLQQHPPDYQWYAPDQFPPDAQHKANGKENVGMQTCVDLSSGFCSYGGLRVSIPSGVRHENCQQSHTVTTTTKL
ncbi:hypothetical protein CB1_000816004 [Camelus ferus]|nr:hypothetical protein CB1_000816004 [Camelus ferus]